MEFCDDRASVSGASSRGDESECESECESRRSDPFGDESEVSEVSPHAARAAAEAAMRRDRDEDEDEESEEMPAPKRRRPGGLASPPAPRFAFPATEAPSVLAAIEATRANQTLSRMENLIALRDNAEDVRTFAAQDMDIDRAGPDAAGGDGADGEDDEDLDIDTAADARPEFREAVADIKRVLRVFKARISEQTRFEVTKDQAETFHRQIKERMEKLKEAHDVAVRACRTQDQTERVVALCRRAQGLGHCLTNVCKNLYKAWSFAGNEPDDQTPFSPIKASEEFVSYDDLCSDKRFTDYHKLLKFVMDTFRACEYKREGEDVYGRITTAGPDGAPCETVAWERKCSIEEFVNNYTSMGINPIMWLIKSKERNPVPRIVDHLCSSNEPEFSDVNRSRFLFSFDNGVYDAEENEFHGYPLATGSPLAAKGAPSAGNHFRGVRFPVDAWTAVKADPGSLLTPDGDDGDGNGDGPGIVDTRDLDKVLKDQDITGEALLWLYFSIGRMIYPIGEHDDLQYFPYFDGTAGCGKSTIIKVIQSLYDTANVGIVSNNIEVKFGLSSFYDKWICVAPEIKGNWKMEPTEFQSMASGESVSIAVKNKNTIQKEWKVPVALAGNELPDFNDLAGSVSRRLLVFKFVNKPEKEDAGILARIRANMGHIILKSNMLYKYMTSNGFNESLWSIVPDYFKNIRDETQRTLNPLVDFMIETQGVSNGRVSAVQDKTRDRNGNLVHSLDFHTFKEAVNDFVKEKRNGKKLDERAFELHKVKSVVEQYGCRIQFVVKSDGTVNTTRIGSILGMRAVLDDEFQESDRRARRAATVWGADSAPEAPRSPESPPPPAPPRSGSGSGSGSGSARRAPCVAV